MQHNFSIRGSQEPLTPTLSPQERGEGEEGLLPCDTIVHNRIAVCSTHTSPLMSLQLYPGFLAA